MRNEKKQFKKPKKRKPNRRIMSTRHLLLESLERRFVLTGTPSLIDLNASGASDPSDFTAVGEITFFVADDGTHGRELWVTDGTASGTDLVKDIGTGSSSPQQLVEFKGELFFVADDGVNGKELWKSDGTASGTTLVKDVYSGSTFDNTSYSYSANSSNPQELRAVDGLLFFTANDGVNGTELWKSDGTASGTTLVKDVYSGSSFDNTSYSYSANSSSPQKLTAVDGLLFFTANDGVNGTELWKSDGTASGTTLVKDVYSGSSFDNTSYSYSANSSSPQKLTAVDGLLFFTANDGVNGTELWKSDGTASGTTLVKDIHAGSSFDYTSYSYTANSSNPQHLTDVDGFLFFIANDGVHGDELWRTDGTSSGTFLVKDIKEGSGASVSQYAGLTESNGTLFFSADDGLSGHELWKSDGTEAGTVLINDINPGTNTSYGTPNNSYPFYMKSVDGVLYFSALSGGTGRELWQSDGTTTGTVLVSDTVAGSSGSYPNKLALAGDTLIFSGNNGTGRDLYVLAPEGEETTNSVRVSIFVNGQQVTIPANIGVNSDGSMAAVFTDSTNGQVHASSGSAVTLGDFFDTWRTNAGLAGNNANAVLSDSQLLNNVEDTTSTVQMFVNGQVSTAFDDYVLQDGDAFVLIYGSNPVVSLNTNFGAIVIELFATNTPGTVDNFLNYVNDGDYMNSFFHRSVNNFVIQSGGFTTSSTTFTSTTQFSSVPTDASILNEPGISNVRTTVAMAKTSDPNSATSQFFVNLSDENTFLDDPNNSGGFTVFGQVLDMTAADVIAALPINNIDDGLYAELPISTSNQLAVIQSVIGQGEVAGVKFSDGNANGVQDSGEFGLAGVSIFIDGNNNGLLDPGEAATTTDGDGRYLLQVEPGTYSVRSQVSAGKVTTVPSGGSYLVTVEIGREVDARNFGEADLPAPTGIDLLAGSDSGASSTDNLTKLNNAGGATLQFEVTGVTPGAEVKLFSDGIQIGTATALTSVVTVTTDGSTSLSDGSHAITATQAISGGASAASTALTITIDATPPAPIASLAPDIAQIEQAYSFDADSPDEGQTGVLYSLANAPSGMTIDTASGVVSWTPTAAQAVPQSFSIEVSDSAGNTSSQDVELTVLGVIPAFPEAYTVAEDSSLTVDAVSGVLANDGDGDSGALTAVVVEQPTNGPLTFNPDGSFTYTPIADFFGKDSFTYQATDGVDNTNVAKVTINVTNVNDQAVPLADSYTTVEDTVLTVSTNQGVLANDTDPDSDSLTATIASQASNGSVAFSADGSFTYTPNANYAGSDSFTYTVNDGTVISDPVTVNLTVTDASEPPTAVADSYSVGENNVLTIEATSGVLNNDTDPDSTSLIAIVSSQPTNGSLTLNSDGSFTYTPNANFFGSDSFAYVVSDGVNTADPATVTITVTESDANNSLSGYVYLDKNGNGVRDDGDWGVPGVQITLTGTDVSGNSINFTMLTTNEGLYVFDELPAGTYQLSERQPAALMDGIESMDALNVTSGNDLVTGITLSGGQSFTQNNFGEAALTPVYNSIVWRFASTNRALLLRNTIAYAEEVLGNVELANAIRAGGTEAPTETAPVAVNDSFSTRVNSALSVSAATGVLANDTDADGDPLTAQLVTSTTNGSLLLNPDGSFAYTPNSDFSGSDSFTYTASDGVLTSTGTVTITVTGENSAPVAAVDSYSVNEDQTLSISSSAGVLSNDTDSDGDALTASIVTSTTHGSLTLNFNGSFTYTPNANFTGTDTFTYQVNDGFLSSNSATVSITVNSVNDNPVAGDSSYTATEDQTLTIDALSGALSNDSDLDGDTLTAQLVALPSNGTLTFDSDGSFTYTPNADFHGTDTFSYSAADGAGGSDQASVTINVASVNDAPVANTNSYSTDEDTTLAIDAVMGVLGNDTDVEGDTLSAALTDPPDHGTLTLNSNGSLTYTPAANFNGTDMFSYVASDGLDDSLVTQVAISVLAVEDPLAVQLPAELTNPLNIASSTVGQTIDFIVSVLDPDDSDYSFQLDLESSGIPDGEAKPTIDLNTGRFLWTPTTTGRFEIRIITVNDDGEVDQETFLIDILPA